VSIEWIRGLPVPLGLIMHILGILVIPGLVLCSKQLFPRFYRMFLMSRAERERLAARRRRGTPLRAGDMPGWDRDEVKSIRSRSIQHYMKIPGAFDGSYSHRGLPDDYDLPIGVLRYPNYREGRSLTVLFYTDALAEKFKRLVSRNGLRNITYTGTIRRIDSLNDSYGMTCICVTVGKTQVSF